MLPYLGQLELFPHLVEFECVCGDPLHPWHDPFLPQFSDVDLDLQYSPVSVSREAEAVTCEASLGLRCLPVITQRPGEDKSLFITGCSSTPL